MKKEIEIIQTSSFHTIDPPEHKYRIDLKIYENGTFKKDSSYTQTWSEVGK